MTIQCRFCATPLTHLFADLGQSPVSNAFRRLEEAAEPEPFFPLRAFVCSACKLVQLQDFRAPEQLFTGDYAYFSSFSDSWLRHSEAYAGQMIQRCRLDDGSRVVEIASNDGYLLQFFKNRGIPVLGVEPCANVAEVARQQRGIPSVVRFFGEATARDLRAEGYAADLMAANNVLAHVPDINDFIAGFKILLKPDGIITFEFPHLLQLIRNNQFDTIYHEHYSYLSLLTVERILAAHGLRVFDVEELSTHGGSLRLLVCHQQGNMAPGAGLLAVRARESAAGLDELTIYGDFARQVKATKRALLRLLIDLKEQGKRIAAYGAPAKGNTLLNYCGIRTDFIDFTVDRNPHKQGMFLPGTGIPILPVAAIVREKPDYVLILPWNLQEEIMAQQVAIRDWGGQFIVPIPQVAVIP